MSACPPDAGFFPLVYDELRRLAAAKLAGEPAGHSLDATALVHEAYLRLGGGAFADRSMFMRAAAVACSDLLDRFGSLTSHHIANNVAWYCLLAPRAVANRAAPVRLARLAVNDAPEAEKPTFLNTLGAALYRAGRSQEALRRLEEGIRKRGGESLPQDWVFLAMAHHQLGHHAEARRWLDQLRAYRANEIPATFWNELEIRLLRSEAEAVILYDPAFPSDPFAP